MIHTSARALRSAGTQAWISSKRLLKPGLVWGSAAAFGGGLVLAAPSLGGRSLPLAACLSLGVPFFPYSIPAALGAAVGYFLAFPWDLALESFAVTLLIFIGAAIFHETALPPALLSVSLTAAVGAVFLLDGGISGLSLSVFAAKLALAGTAPLLYRRAIEGKHNTARLLLSALALTALAGFAPPWGKYPAVALAFLVSSATGQQSILPALLCGAALDLANTGWTGLTACLGLGAWLGRLLPRSRSSLRAVVLPGVCMLWQLYFGRLRWGLLVFAALGAGAGLLLPLSLAGPQAPQAAPSEAGRDKDRQLRKLGQVFYTLHRELTGASPAASQTALAEIYDNAADRVCRCCVARERCWQTESRETYDALVAAGSHFTARGLALREDFPEAFSERCSHMEGFLTAVNQELGQTLARRQIRSRAEESRQILADQYLFLAGYLDALGRSDGAPLPPRRFTPELAVRTACVPGAEICGDRGCAIYDRTGGYNVLLCDGMGTGAPARQESDRAVRVLTGLLDAGVAPEAAMQTLNDFYVLREDAAFSTVDLLRADLASGEAVLYKWGAAPSYYRTAAGTEKIGTASPPPGIRADGRKPEQYKLSLKEGETLIMVSDGAFGEETEGRVDSFRGGSVRDLAAYILAGAGQNSRDDLTAIVLRLRRDLD